MNNPSFKPIQLNGTEFGSALCVCTIAERVEDASMKLSRNAVRLGARKVMKISKSLGIAWPRRWSKVGYCNKVNYLSDLGISNLRIL